MASLQQTPITFRCRSPPSTQIPTAQTAKLSLTSTFATGLKIPKLKIKSRSSSKAEKRHRGASGARMADTAASYAAALADVATSNGTLEETSADMEKVEKIFSDPEVMSFFNNPTIEDSKKRDVIAEIVKSSDVQAHVSNFLNILLDMKRIDILNDIVKEFEVTYNRLTDTELAVVTSVVQLDSQHLAQIAKGVQRLTGAKNVRIKTVTDPSLVAGFTIRYGHSGSKLIDMSVKKQLEDIASQLDVGEIQLAV